jgi:hypothetical protein
MNKKQLIAALTELAEELDMLKTGCGDVRWLKTQDTLVRQAITALTENQ